MSDNAMINEFDIRRCSRLLLACIVVVASINLAYPAFAQSRYSTTGAEVQLLAPGGLPRQDGRYVSGLLVDLDDGWKTYWRHPGPVGLAPSFDTSSSTNLKSLEVLYPEPVRFIEGEHISIGYTNDVVFPFLVEPLVAGQPVTLNLRGLIGVCESLCVPLPFGLQVELQAFGARDAVANRLINEAYDAQPREWPTDKTPAPAFVMLGDGQRSIQFRNPAGLSQDGTFVAECLSTGQALPRLGIVPSKGDQMLGFSYEDCHDKAVPAAVRLTWIGSDAVYEGEFKIALE